MTNAQGSIEGGASLSSVHEPGCDSEEIKWTFAASRGGEVSLSKLSPQERAQFSESDSKEWAAILKSGAVKVLSIRASAAIREKQPERVISSRMVRRWKPVVGTNTAPTAKSRWCVHGHQDPDTGGLMCYSPTPATSSIMMFMQVAANLNMRADIADVKNAFCQSDSFSRPTGQLFVEPCEGLGLPEGCLIQLLVNVYGLDDAPLAWRRTVVGYLSRWIHS